jgi:hypothetical protein
MSSKFKNAKQAQQSRRRRQTASARYPSSYRSRIVMRTDLVLFDPNANMNQAILIILTLIYLQDEKVMHLYSMWRCVCATGWAGGFASLRRRSSQKILGPLLNQSEV